MCKIHTIGLNQNGAIRCTTCLRFLSNREVENILREISPNNWEETYKVLISGKRSARESLGIPETFDDIMDDMLLNLNK